MAWNKKKHSENMNGNLMAMILKMAGEEVSTKRDRRRSYVGMGRRMKRPPK
jgi:hypothetical protein